MILRTQAALITLRTSLTLLSLRMVLEMLLLGTHPLTGGHAAMAGVMRKETKARTSS